MTAKVEITYSELLDHWSWEVTVDNHSAYGVESDHDNAFAAAEFELEREMEEEVESRCASIASLMRLGT